MNIRACILLSLLGSLTVAAQDAPSAIPAFTPPSVTHLDPAIESRVEGILGQLTEEEKIGFLSGATRMNTLGVQRLGIPQLQFNDGAVGLSGGHSTAYPATALLAATWDATVAHDMGVALGHDCQRRGVNVLLAPGVTRAGVEGVHTSRSATR